MKKIGEFVIFRKEVCKIKEIKENYRNGLDYYSLTPLEDESLHLIVPVTSEKTILREPISKKEVEDLIRKIPLVKPIESEEKILENEYKVLLNSGNLEDYIKIIKTTYLRNKERLDNKRKISDKDNYYFNLAEKYLYNEFSIVLNKDFEETKKYVIDRVLEKN